MDIEARRQELETQLVGLREGRGHAALAGEPFDAGQIATIEAELAALVDAENALHRQRAIAEAEAARERRDRLERSVGAADAARLAAIDAAEIAAKTLAEALAEVERQTALQQKANQALGRPLVGRLLSQRDRLSGSIASVLRASVGGEWGLLRFPDAGSMALKPDKPWSSQLWRSNQ